MLELSWGEPFLIGRQEKIRRQNKLSSVEASYLLIANYLLCYSFHYQSVGLDGWAGAVLRLTQPPAELS